MLTAIAMGPLLFLIIAELGDLATMAITYARHPETAIKPRFEFLALLIVVFIWVMTP